MSPNYNPAMPTVSLVTRVINEGKWGNTRCLNGIIVPDRYTKKRCRSRRVVCDTCRIGKRRPVMRTRSISARGLAVQAVAGTYVVLLGFDLAPQDRTGLLGFAVQRSDQAGDIWLSGGITFPSMITGRDGQKGTNIFPIQKFRWGDFSAQPATHYTYKLQAMYGSPGSLEAGDSVTVDVQTQDPLHVGSDGHQVHFNRFASASQTYVNLFGDKAPNQVPDGAAFRWLSRGLEESLLAFIERASDETYSLHLSVYEFQKDSF